MGRVTVSPSGRLMLDGVELSPRDPRLWGSAGRNITSTDGDPTSQNDPRYYVQDDAIYTSAGDSGDAPTPTYRLRPEIAQRLGGRVQLHQSGVGGFSEAIDPSKVEYDPEFGFLTTPDNIKGPDSGWDDRMNLGMMIAAGGAMGGAALAHGAAAGGAAGSAAGGAPGGMSLTAGGSGGVGAGMGASGAATGALTGTGGGALAALNMGGGASPMTLEAAGSGGVGAGGGAGSPGITGGGSVGPSLSSSLMNWARANPQQLARLGAGLYGLVGGGQSAPQGSPRPSVPQGGPGSPGSSPSGVQAPTGNFDSSMAQAVRNNVVSALMRRHQPTGGW